MVMDAREPRVSRLTARRDDHVVAGVSKLIWGGGNSRWISTHPGSVCDRIHETGRYLDVARRNAERRLPIRIGVGVSLVRRWATH